MTSKIASALLGLFLVLGMAGALTTTTPHVAQARDMADCDGLRGRDYDLCRMQRAAAEAQDQRTGNRRDGNYRVRGTGRLYHKCKNAEAKWRRRANEDAAAEIDSATSADEDCR